MTRSGGGTIEPEQRAAARVVGFLYGATTAHARAFLLEFCSWCSFP
jgi:hypothetical protein